MSATTLKLKSLLESHISPLSFQHSAYDPLLKAIGNAQVVLIGDGSHGTYEFYAHRANLTKRLIEEQGFTAVAVEADWPDALRINRYIHGGAIEGGSIKSARDALRDFERFPKWMWKNEVMPPFIQFLREHNNRVMKTTGDAYNKVSLYGMDLYSLHRSAQAVIQYLERIDPEGAKKARKKYNCFERFGEDTTRYALETQFGLAKDCHAEVISNLRTLLLNHRKYIEEQSDGHYGHPAEEQFFAEMNALVVKDAEEYYRTMMLEDTRSWNLSVVRSRDDHFARTLVNIANYLGSTDVDGSSTPAKIIVWAHNSHNGDARATDMGRRRGEINVGQRCREIFGDDNVFNVGFLTNRGTVTAAYGWDEPSAIHRMNPPHNTSIEHIFDEWAKGDSIIITHKIENTPEGKAKKREVPRELTEFLNEPRYQRFIGVIYRRDTELPSHYSKCSVADQYDAVVHIKESQGIQPLEPEDTWKGFEGGEADLTFPFGQ
ncbi:predicted protein [Postia placenta Mad-698-R]|uniref:Erythromycin esterase n=1 Tax=Postia placenta MAD-698-R-SB12 TaxID=670580 RepID=A0A1X6NGE0_9APHY|nr:hypothetical protein POSPLADRAFT_1042907 [Postia placenta MAD-698-R-SB12]EED79127.1 predicted protein [Postia placenta Mad-698-R]OSX67711.1 hypothetical protein POSPLADRAFT_1042907 [Postia placenta MAD-698-R-SB12]